MGSCCRRLRWGASSGAGPQLTIQTDCRATAATPWRAVDFLEGLMRNDQEFWWEKLFRFSPVEFFEELVPVLDLPESFTVDG